MKKLKQVKGNLEQSMVTHTEFIPINQGFDVSIGFSQAIRLPNAKELVQTEFQRDIQLYQKMCKQQMAKRTAMKKNKVVQQPIEADSINEFLQIIKENDIKPSKWVKPDKSQSEKSKSIQQPIKQVQAEEQLKSMGLEINQSVKMTDSVAQACEKSVVKVGKWKQAQQALQKSMKVSKIRGNKGKKSCLIESVKKEIEKIEQQPNVQIQQSQESQATVHLQDLQTSAVTEEMGGSSMNVHQNLKATTQSVDVGQDDQKDQRQYVADQLNDEQEEDDQEEQEEDQEQQQQQQEEEQDQQEDEEQKQQDQEQKGEEEDEQDQDEDQEIQDSSIQIDTSVQVEANQVSEVSIGPVLKQSQVAKRDQVDYHPMKWSKPEQIEQWHKRPVDQQQLDNNMTTVEDEQEWLLAQNVIKGLHSLIN